MKVLITANAPELEAPVNPRFGRADYFVVVDSETLKWQAHPNPGVGATGGAGAQAAEFVAGQEVAAAISGDFGPNAYLALAAAGIKMYLLGPSQTVSEAIANLTAGKLEQVHAAASAGRHGGQS